MKITVDRDSVCMGDDVNSHVRTVVIDDGASCGDLLKMLRGSGFFANVSGNDVVWVLTAGSVCVLAYYTKTGRVLQLISETRLSGICGLGKLNFKYYTSPEKWEQIQRSRRT
ncbi:MAG: hypothetical protein K2N56_12975 [Oscillospiraceae bacterium]|nr:hypothetical protein [Oscillospiraceae bacterium]